MTRQYPRWIHHPNGRSVIVNSHEHEEAMGDGWYDTPADFPAPDVAPETAPAVPESEPKVKGKPGPKPKVKE